MEGHRFGKGVGVRRGKVERNDYQVVGTTWLRLTSVVVWLCGTVVVRVWQRAPSVVSIVGAARGFRSPYH